MVISIQNLSKKIGRQEILHSINLTIPQGKIISFIGPNGAGKSTLLGLISRLDIPTTGTVTIDGVDVQKTNSEVVAKLLAILKQSNNINLRLTIEDLVSFGRYPYCQGKLKDEDKKMVNQAIDYMGLDDLRYKYLDQLSGGQKQRAYIAMVLAQDTPYVFLDEPLNNLDMKYSVQIMSVLKDLVENHGKTVIVVLHDINFASAYSDIIVALKEGQVVCQGEVKDIMTPEKLHELYDIHIDIHELNNQYVATYFKPKANCP
ncbi:iron ABC transporter ATP-binding protein [Psittacicella melopsittaci]|uniref:Iron ABC transporter ATP-binding protein n=1 Tax=Psittacicella melopsittaci TaxID=2028576 RepID=A0A3A1YBW6_9GAMM|nr:ATP-binding cassette domain-containing protein [Psittacicella melopsittaci]RIY33704.1 iron ABC transporter ATP-binding protein [Psittacicella melopsittaci]